MANDIACLSPEHVCAYSTLIKYMYFKYYIQVFLY